MIVVDEQGNEYEATYPKRAKGLVKNGRARFVGENKICLACPPDKVMEENEMEENKQAVKKTEDNNLTAKEAKNNNLTAIEIFEKIAELQKQLSENSNMSLQRLGDAISNAFDGEENERDYSQIAEICDVFKARELNLLKMLELYEKMYDDIQNEKAKKVELIQRAFDNNMAFINDSDIASEDKFAALGYVTDKIAELVAQLMTDERQ